MVVGNYEVFESSTISQLSIQLENPDMKSNLGCTSSFQNLTEMYLQESR